MTLSSNAAWETVRGHGGLLASKQIGARVSGMVNICECLINVVTGQQAKVADRLEKACGGHRLFSGPCHGHPTPPADRADLTHSVIYVKHGKPVSSSRESSRKASRWGGG